MTEFNAKSQVAAAGPTDGQPYGNGMNQVGSGPAALLYDLSNELVMIYGELQAIYNRMTVMETTVQKSTIEAGADAQIGASKAQADAIACQAAGSFISGGLAAGTAIATYAGTSDATTQLNKEQTSMNQLENLNKTTILAAKGGTDVEVSNAPGNPTNGDVEARAAELQRGEWATSNPRAANPQTEEDIAYAKNLDKMACSKLQEGDPSDAPETKGSKLTSVQKNLQEAISTQASKISALQTQIQVTQTRYKTYSEMVSGVSNGITQSVQASYTAKQGLQQACQQISQGTQTMANGTAESTRQGIGKYYDSIAGIIAAARQGAQAYAQT